MQNHWNILIFLILLGVIKASGWTEVDIIRVESLVKNSAVVNYDIRAKKINRTTCVVAGNIEILVDSTEASLYLDFSELCDFYRNPFFRIFAGVRVFYSSKGNNQFRAFPMRADPAPVPKLLNGIYRTYIMDDLKPPVSNLPYSDDKDVDLTELIVKPANYTINAYTISLKRMPKTIPNGLYKVLVEITTKASGDLVSGFSLLFSAY